MTSRSRVYVAGVGSSPPPSRGSSAKAVVTSLVSAATKALLDAGVTCDDVSHGVTSGEDEKSRHGSKVFGALDEGGITVHEVETESELDSSFCLVRDRNAQCVLMIATEKSAAVAAVLVSDNFLGRHPYLKDSAALLREADNSWSTSEVQVSLGLSDVCQMVWALRGWLQPKHSVGREGRRIYYRGNSNQGFELSRVYADAIPEWKAVEHKQDGKHRLGYNPAIEMRDISQEDLEAVRASGKRRSEVDEWALFKRRGGDRAALARL